MARSRNIKPGLFTNDDLAECDIFARFLFTGLWTIADRAGRLEDKPKKIKIQVLPYDDVDCDELLQQLHNHGFIVRYSVDDKSYIQIVHWDKHQNPHKNEAESEIPGTDKINTSKVIEQSSQHIVNNEENTTTDKISTSTDKIESVTENIGSTPADSLNLIPDSLNLIPSHSEPTANATAYAFCGEVIKLNHDDFGKWGNLYPNVNLVYELERLDLEFKHDTPKNWFITASQKLSYQNKNSRQTRAGSSINHVASKPSNPTGFKVVNA